MEHEVSLLKFDLTNLTKFVRMLNSGSDVLDNILMTGRDAKDMSGLGYNEITKKRHHLNMNNFQSKPQMLKKMSQHYGRRNIEHSKRRH